MPTLESGESEEYSGGREGKALIRESEEFQALLLDSSATPSALVNLDGLYLRVNQRYAELFGSDSPAAYVGTSSFERLPPEAREQAALETKATVEIGRDTSSIRSMSRDDGRTLEVECQVHVLRDEHDAPWALLCHAIDITERRRAQRLLAETQTQFETLADLAPVGIYMTDAEGRCTFVNQHWQHLAGIDAERAAGEGWKHALHPDDRQSVFAAWNKMVASNGEWGLEYRFKLPNGRVTHVFGTATEMRNERGELTGYIGTNVDIGARKRTQDELNAIFRDAPLVMMLVDNKRRVVRMNAAAEALSQNANIPALGSLIGEALQCVHALYGAAECGSGEACQDCGVRNTVLKTIQSRRTFHQREASLTAQGVLGPSRSDVLVYTTPLRVLEDDLVLVCLEDITERKRATDQAARFVRVLERSLNEIYIADAKTLRFVNVNLGARENLGYSMDELQRLTPLHLQPTLSPTAFAAMTEPLRTGELEKLEFNSEHLRKDGSRYPVEVHLQLMREGAPVYVAVVLDLTKRAAAEDEKLYLQAQLQQAQKMEAIGQLAGGVAHDFNNLLTVIRASSHLIRAEMPDRHEWAEDMDRIDAAAARAGSLTSQLLAYSRRQVMRPKILDLNRLVLDMKRLLSRIIGEDVRLVTELANDLGSVLADPGQLEQVIMNLTLNARDAMPSGGTLRLETRNAQLSVEMTRQHLESVPGGYVVLSVSDDGCGMSDEIQKRAFEPFYTSKAVGEGTGLGLSTVHGIVHQSGGSVWLESEVGRGTTVKVHLPLATGSELSKPPKEAPKPTRPKAETTILVVEDDRAVLRIIERILTRGGYRVFAAESLAQALEQFDAQGTTIDMLLTDVVMPNGSGRQVADALTAKNAQLKVAFISGHPDDSMIRHGVSAQGVSLLPKPFTSNELLRFVEGVLEAPEVGVPWPA